MATFAKWFKPRRVDTKGIVRVTDVELVNVELGVPVASRGVVGNDLKPLSPNEFGKQAALGVPDRS